MPPPNANTKHAHEQPPWPQLSYVLAKEILTRDWHHGFLSAQEAALFESATESFERWFSLMHWPRHSRPSPDVERERTILRIRSMLFEQLVPHLYHSDRPCCQHARIDLERIYSEARALPTPPQSPDRVASIDIDLTSNVKKEDDEPENDKPETDAKDLPLVTYSPNIPINDVYHTLEHDHAAMTELQKLEEFEAQEEMNDEEDKNNLQEHSLSMFNGGQFNLKYLLQGIATHRDQLALSDKDLRHLLSDFKPHRTKWASDNKIGQEELYEAIEKVLTDLKNFTEHSTPFLNKVSKREAPDYFEVIKRPMDLGTVTKKMKALQYRSKKEFASDLYLIYDNCLLYNTNPQASEYRKHAYAMRRKTDRLLSRVPDIVIKDKIDADVEDFGDEGSDDNDSEVLRPSRKTPGGSKQPGRKGSADRFSRERSLTRESSAPAGTEFTHGSSDNESNYQTPNGHTHAEYGGKQVKSQNDTEDDAKSVGEDVDADFAELQDQMWRDLTKKTRAKLAIDVERQYQYSFPDREAITRSALDMERFALIENMHHKPAMTQKLVKCPNDRFSRWNERSGGSASLYDEVDFDSSDDDNLDAFFSRKISKPKTEEDDAMRTDLFLPEYLLSCGLPEITALSDNLHEEVPMETRPLSRKGSMDNASEISLTRHPRGFTDVSLDVYPSVHFPNHGLNTLMDRNLQQLQKIRQVYTKCNAVRNNVPLSALASSISLEDPSYSLQRLIPSPSSTLNLPFSPPPSDSQPLLSASDLHPSHQSTPPLIIDPNSGHRIMQRTVTKLLAHAGFEGAHESAFSVITDIALDYMSNVGKMLRSYSDDYGRRMSTEEIIMHVLFENGVENISDLETYIRDDIERYGYRLEELHRKLESSYQDLLSGPTERSDDEETALADDETFITGSFGEDIGEDYFGFKNLGLDQEYNLSALSHIPARLWFGVNKDKDTSIKTSKKEAAPKYPPPPAFTPVTSDKALIGLLQPVFQKKLSVEGGMVEDEYILNRHRNRPRWPPTNKTASGRKKPLKDTNTNSNTSQAGASGEARKTKRKRPLEEVMAEKAERAEKKRQKQEERQQKMAEKEQKRKMREEQREQERQAKQEAKLKKAQAKKSGNA
ncbi:hypothetical protein BCR43DRAFT_512654 [Syncephalastrum racemosum]|uniref:Bromo domain-containing protein n=1 Tax=Syncephalastrum racemosum TaxID=13706 RepID=A0A1X2HH79_SYNRA|nr:hypothetical protein BCR43DRAFT_512654 [Syncephalastrum racemosum]